MFARSSSLLSLYLAIFGASAAPLGHRPYHSQNSVDSADLPVLVDITFSFVNIRFDGVSAPANTLRFPGGFGGSDREQDADNLRLEVDAQSLKEAKSDPLCGGFFSGATRHVDCHSQESEGEYLMPMAVFRRPAGGYWRISCELPIDTTPRGLPEYSADDVESQIKEKNSGKDVAVSEFDIEIV
ncbi:hypothetical protein H072_10705 [Dactylellina haptotyla CBS 200.50]|uniref:Ubiquitin 3 binding protein But2 C-terminal domain-containing protein n=1 Tax=Dactylellina haptotyla (strain CBS 200.50) TaxID=1284197 RepID=S7ZZJ8_DACHA|nr:hypothetical protein H072_10705 [Dactylellina haptotyla CBS 200.50]